MAIPTVKMECHILRAFSEEHADEYLNETWGLTNESRDALEHRFVEQA
ncbi:MAG: hypothetical protein P8L66_03950 [Rhodospirillaceae bacterium]|nr:hypothetical protein [Rhodospirillaceae bacterium]